MLLSITKAPSHIKPNNATMAREAKDSGKKEQKSDGRDRKINIL